MTAIPMNYMRGRESLKAIVLFNENKLLSKVILTIQNTMAPKKCGGGPYLGNFEDVLNRQPDGSLAIAGGSYTGKPEDKFKIKAGGTYDGSFTAKANVITEDSKQVYEAVKEKGMLPIETTVFNENGLTEICKAYTDGTDNFLPVKSTNIDYELGTIEEKVELIKMDMQYGAVKRKLNKLGVN
ncbi:MAG: hypothetical protein PHC66_00700 [Candidatus Nanoarchaeia archaeon]|nr:hypothetical protein [Candidatus Nanoarchaeia archaeon]MDD5239537.1 hypothetical protein [Candidatus Nanoarchaeia archaeon]